MGTGAWALALGLLSAPVLADWRADLQNPIRSGQGEFTYFAFHIYTAELWTEHLPFDLNKTFALRLTYHHHISRDRFVKTGLGEMKRIAGDAWNNTVGEQWRIKMEGALTDVGAEESITGVYFPDRGARFYHGDQFLSEVDDPAFARAFFAIWLGPRARDLELREKLTGLPP